MAAKSYAWMEAKTANFNMVTDIYIDAVDGDDSTGDGSISSPYKTMAKIQDDVQATITPGTTLRFKAGQTHENQRLTAGGGAAVFFTTSGTRRQPIVVDRYGDAADADPILINLGADVSGLFTLKGNGLWFYEYVNVTVNGLWVDNERLWEAATIADISAAQPWNWDKGATDPDNLGELAGIWYMPPTGVPSDTYISRNVNGSILRMDGQEYFFFQNLDLRYGVEGIKCDDGGATGADARASYHVIQDCRGEQIRRTVAFNINDGVDGDDGAWHVTVRRNYITGGIHGIFFSTKNNSTLHHWISIYENQLINPDFDDIETTFQLTHGTTSDHEQIGVQNMVQMRVFDNFIDLRMKTTQLSDWWGILTWIDSLGTSYEEDCQFTRNVIFNTDNGGFVLGAGTVDITTRRCYIWNNIISQSGANSTSRAITMNADNVSVGRAFDNVMAHNIIHLANNSAFRIRGEGGSVVKNNLISSNDGLLIDMWETHVANEIDYNGYEDAGTGTPFNDNATDVSFADWKTNTSQDANSYDTRPDYVGRSDPTTAQEFIQVSHSDSLGKGTDLTSIGIVKDFNGVPFGANKLGAFTTTGEWVIIGVFTEAFGEEFY